MATGHTGDITRTASHKSALSLGSCISAAVTGTVDPHHRARFQLFLFGTGDQRAVERLPGRRANRADRSMQHRFFWRPRQRQPGKGAKRRRILQVKGQLPPAADRSPPGSPTRAAHPANRKWSSARSRSGVRQRPRISWPGRCALDALSAPAVRGGLSVQRLDPKCTRNHGALPQKIARFLSDSRSLEFMDRH
jgi:hypothetical protein